MMTTTISPSKSPDLEPWIETYKGKHLYFLDPKPDQIDIEDIAHSLANECRFGGHTSEFYSVAEHSIFVATFVSKEKALYGLLHDASEAYLRDIASPIKQHLSNYKELEDKLMRAVAQKFELPEDFWHDPEVKEADTMALKSEAKHLLPSGGKDWLHLFPTKVEAWVRPYCFPPKKAKELFLEIFNDLTGSVVWKPPQKIIIAK